MAKSPAHRLGQIVGDALEHALYPVIKEVGDHHGLYLDTKGTRAARGTAVKVRWADGYGNLHDLDFVLERGGTAEEVGSPVAFIESAWRRYTKHSKNKAQEMQGAIGPIMDAHDKVRPFAAAVVAGDWTSTALSQLVSQGIRVLHISTAEMVGAFASVGVDIATDEDTADDHAQKQVDIYEALGPAELETLAKAIRACEPDGFKALLKQLEAAVTRKVSAVVVLPLHGTAIEATSLVAATDAISTYANDEVPPEPARWEVSIRFDNDDRIDAQFATRAEADEFLQTFA